MKNFSTSIQRRKRGKRTEYLARLTYYDKTGKRKGVSKSAPTHWDAKRELQDLIDQHVAGGAEVLEARNMTFAALAEHCKETRYCEAFYDERGRKLYGVREPKKFASMISRLVSSLGHLKLSDITVSHLQQYRRKRLSTKTNRGTYTDVATVNRELSTCRAMLNDAVVNDWLVRSPFVKAKKGELIAVAHEAKRQVVLTPENEQKLLHACGTSKRRHLRAMIIAAIDTGCRQGELRRLRWSDVDLQANTLRVTSYKGKTVNRRFVPITDRLRAAFATELRGRQVHEYDIADLLGHTIQSVTGTYVGRESLLSYFVRFHLMSSTRRYIGTASFLSRGTVSYAHVNRLQSRSTKHGGPGLGFALPTIPP